MPSSPRRETGSMGLTDKERENRLNLYRKKARERKLDSVGPCAVEANISTPVDPMSISAGGQPRERADGGREQMTPSPQPSQHPVATSPQSNQHQVGHGATSPATGTFRTATHKGAVTGYDLLNQTISDLSSDLTAKRIQVKTLTEERDTAQQQAKIGKQTVDILVAKKTELTANVKDLEAQLQALNSELALKTQQVTETVGKEQSVQKTTSPQTAQLGLTQPEVDGRRGQAVEDLEVSLLTANQRIAELTMANDELKSKLKQQAADMEQYKQGHALPQELEAARKNMEKLEADFKELCGRLTGMEEDLAISRQREKALAGQLAETTRQLTAATTALQDLHQTQEAEQDAHQRHVAELESRLDSMAMQQPPSPRPQPPGSTAVPTSPQQQAVEDRQEGMDSIEAGRQNDQQALHMEALQRKNKELKAQLEEVQDRLADVMKKYMEAVMEVQASQHAARQWQVRAEGLEKGAGGAALPVDTVDRLRRAERQEQALATQLLTVQAERTSLKERLRQLEESLHQRPTLLAQDMNGTVKSVSGTNGVDSTTAASIDSAPSAVGSQEHTPHSTPVAETPNSRPTATEALLTCDGLAELEAVRKELATLRRERKELEAELSAEKATVEQLAAETTTIPNLITMAHEQRKDAQRQLEAQANLVAQLQAENAQLQQLLTSSPQGRRAANELQTESVDHPVATGPPRAAMPMTAVLAGKQPVKQGTLLAYHPCTECGPRNIVV